jgi:hypothetical protein
MTWIAFIDLHDVNPIGELLTPYERLLGDVD